VEDAVNREFRKDKQAALRVLNQPHTITVEEIDQAVDIYFKQAEDKDVNALNRKLGVDKDTLKQLVEARKQVAANATPGSGSHGNSGGEPAKGDAFDLWLQNKL
jgi:hypothetical protein